MSIIYDALKKVEKKVHNADNKPLSSNPKANEISRIKLLLLSLLVLGFGFFLAKFLLTSSFVTKTIQASSGIVSVRPSESLKKEVPVVTQGPPQPAPISETPPPPAPPTRTAPASSLVLNGVFESEDGNYALINNQIVKEGDTIEGSKVTKVTLEGVELESGGTVIKLKK